MSKQIKLKSLLKEGFAWERKPGKSLPTIQEVMDEYESKQEKEISVKEDETFNHRGVLDLIEEFIMDKVENSVDPNEVEEISNLLLSLHNKINRDNNF
jgi:hypothetical protein